MACDFISICINVHVLLGVPCVVEHKIMPNYTMPIALITNIS